MLSAFEITSVPATGPGLMKGCEIQCGNRFPYLLIWPCQSTVLCQGSRHGAAVCMCVQLTHFTQWRTKKGRLALSLINLCKFKLWYGQNTLKLFGLDVKLWKNRERTGAWKGASAPSVWRPTQHKTKPLVRYKGRILDFHFLNNRHNRITVTLIWMLSFKKNGGWKKGQVTGSQGVLR